METILLAGLGNPGKKYAHTRHNAGFLFVDYFWKKYRDEFDFSDWEFKKNLNAEISVGKIKNSAKKKNTGLNILAVASLLSPNKKYPEDAKIILVKPQTFMNLSGVAVKKALKFYKIKPGDLIVAHDDIDLALGKFKISVGSRAAGHNGVQNVIDQLGTKDFARIRIGVNNRGDKKIPTEKYVLGKLTSAETKKISETISKIVEEII